MRNKIINDDENEKEQYWQLVKLASAIFSRKYDLADYLFLNREMRQILADIERAITLFGSKKELKLFKTLKKEIVKKYAEIDDPRDIVKIWMSVPDEILNKKRKKEEDDEI